MLFHFSQPLLLSEDLFLFLDLFYCLLIRGNLIFRNSIIVRIALLFLLRGFIFCKNLAEDVGITKSNKGESDQEPEQASVNKCSGIEHGDEHDSHRNTDNQNRMGQIQDADKQRIFNSVFHIVLKPCHIGEDIGKQQEVKGYHNAYQNAEDVLHIVRQKLGCFVIGEDQQTQYSQDQPDDRGDLEVLLECF